MQLPMSGRKLTRSRSVAGVYGGVLLTVLLAGCGGSNSLSHTQLAARATTACHQADASVLRLGGPGDGYAGLRKYAGQVSPIVSRLINTLEGLKANAADRPALERYVSALQSGNHGLALLGRASSPAQLAQAISLLDSQSIPSLAHALGAPACGTSISPVA